MNTRFLQASFAWFVMALLLASSVLAQPTEDFDIFVFDVKKGTTQQVTSIPGAGEFNPSFSNNGKQIVQDVVVFSPPPHPRSSLVSAFIPMAVKP